MGNRSPVGEYTPEGILTNITRPCVSVTGKNALVQWARLALSRKQKCKPNGKVELPISQLDDKNLVIRSQNGVRMRSIPHHSGNLLCELSFLPLESS